MPAVLSPPINLEGAWTKSPKTNAPFAPLGQPPDDPSDDTNTFEPTTFVCRPAVRAPPAASRRRSISARSWFDNLLVSTLLLRRTVFR